MADFRELFCEDEARRAQLRAHETLNGIDFIEVATAPPADNQRLLKVFFIGKTEPAAQARLSEMLDALDGATQKFAVEGGVRIKNIQVTAVTRVGEHLEVRVSEPGDFSTYALVIGHVRLPEEDPSLPKLDPAYARCEFSFKAACPTRFDCKPRLICPPEPRTEPLIDYMAKDYASFRQALLDLIPSLVPDWKERREADLGIALVELLAYAGDHLSYYQDAVANEAYLETARQRVSVRRHARLIDYRMHDGTSARTFIHFWVDSPGAIAPGTAVLTRIDLPLGTRMPPHNTVIPVELREQALRAAGAVFETFTETDEAGEQQAQRVHHALNKIPLHAWGNRDCCLPRGATTVDLVGELTEHLAPGDFLLFEEFHGAETGLEADADPRHRQVVRLTAVEASEDPLLPDPTSGTPPPVKLTRVTWDDVDALTFPLCLSATLTQGRRRGEHEPMISVARGNLMLADHGRTILDEEHSGPEALTYPSLRRAHRIRLRGGPLSFRIPLRKGTGTVAALLRTDPGEAEAQVALDMESVTGPLPGWKAVRHLLDSQPFDRDFVVETENDGRALLRFGDGEFGLAPPEASKMTVDYRVGMGSAGNVGADTLVHVAGNGTLPAIEAVRNPLPAWGGIDPEPIAQVKELAPAAFHAEQIRAVTEEDYARAAERHPQVSKAVATFRWTGSWHTVFITVDRKGGRPVTAEFEAELRAFIEQSRLAGYDLEVDGPIFVPLEITIDICVAPDHFRGHVEEALLEALSNRTLPDGSRDFFHPDHFTFGQAVYLSQLYAAVERVEGVDSAEVRVFHRFGKLPDGELEQGFILIGRLEVARLDNDPSLPENGVLRLNMLGGK